MPVFLFAVVISTQIDIKNFILIFIILHFLLYTASNGFNSYYDRDEGSIGTIKYSPEVTKDLLWVSLALDALAIILALFVHPLFSLGCFLYGIASKLYSWNKTRLKRRPVLSWLLTGSGVGSIAFLMSVVFLDTPDFGKLTEPGILLPAAFIGIFILGFYPLTQVYQHEEDFKRGDKTISMMLGIRGTFLLSFILLSISLAGLGTYFYYKLTTILLFLYISLLIPGVLYFLYWWHCILKDEKHANFDHCFRLSIIATAGLNIFCTIAIISFKSINFHL